MKFTSPLSVATTATIMLVVAVNTITVVEAVPDCVFGAADGYNSCEESAELFCKSESDCQQISESKTTEEQQVAPALPTVPVESTDAAINASMEAASATSTTSSMMIMSTTAAVVAVGAVMLL